MSKKLKNIATVIPIVSGIAGLASIFKEGIYKMLEFVGSSYQVARIAADGTVGDPVVINVASVVLSILVIFCLIMSIYLIANKEKDGERRNRETDRATSSNGKLGSNSNKTCRET